MNADTEVIYVTILQAIGFAENALVAIRRGDTSTALSDISGAGISLETARDSLSRQGRLRCEWGYPREKASACTEARLNTGLSLSNHS